MLYCHSLCYNGVNIGVLDACYKFNRFDIIYVSKFYLDSWLSSDKENMNLKVSTDHLESRKISGVCGHF